LGRLGSILRRAAIAHALDPAAGRQPRPVSDFVGVSNDGDVDPAPAEHVRYASYFGAGANRRLDDRLEILPLQYLKLAPALAARTPVQLLSLAPGADTDHFSSGAGADYAADLITHARCVIAEVREAAPRTGEGLGVTRRDLNLWTLSDCARSRPEFGCIGQIEGAVARRVAGLIEDGSTRNLASTPFRPPSHARVAGPSRHWRSFPAGWGRDRRVARVRRADECAQGARPFRRRQFGDRGRPDTRSSRRSGVRPLCPRGGDVPAQRPRLAHGLLIVAPSAPAAALSIQMNIFGLQPVVRVIREAQKQRIAPPFMRGEVKACFAVIDPSAYDADRRGQEASKPCCSEANAAKLFASQRR